MQELYGDKMVDGYEESQLSMDNIEFSHTPPPMSAKKTQIQPNNNNKNNTHENGEQTTDSVSNSPSKKITQNQDLKRSKTLDGKQFRSKLKDVALKVMSKQISICLQSIKLFIVFFLTETCQPLSSYIFQTKKF